MIDTPILPRTFPKVGLQNIPNEQQEILGEAYEQWKVHPITTLFRQQLNILQESFTRQGITDLGDPSIEDWVYKSRFVNIKSIETIKKLIYTLPEFVSNQSKRDK